MIKSNRIFEQDEDGLIYWDEENKDWRNVYGNEIADNQPEPPTKKSEK